LTLLKGTPRVLAVGRITPSEIEGTYCITAKMQVRINRPALIDESLVIISSITKKTRRLKELKMERTLVLIKPDAMQRGLAGTIIARLEKQGLKLVAIKMLHLDKALAERHYAIHTGKPFFNDLVNYISSAPIIAAVFAGEKAVEIARKAMGATDPAKAESGTVRGDFGMDIGRNSVHGSDSVETAGEEIGLFFSQDEILDYPVRS